MTAGAANSETEQKYGNNSRGKCVSVVLFEPAGCLCAAELSLTLVFDSPNIAEGMRQIHAHVSACKCLCECACGSAQGYPLAKANEI